MAGCVLYAAAYGLLSLLKKSDLDEDDFLPISWEDAIVYQISFGICAFSLAVSAGSVLLLPISSISNEILHRYPSSWYIQWLNASLIHGIWNVIFVLSNFCLFLALPFAYLFCESEGLPFLGNRRVRIYCQYMLKYVVYTHISEYFTISEENEDNSLQLTSRDPKSK